MPQAGSDGNVETNTIIHKYISHIHKWIIGWKSTNKLCLKCLNVIGDTSQRLQFLSYELVQDGRLWKYTKLTLKNHESQKK